MDPHALASARAQDDRDGVASARAQDDRDGVASARAQDDGVNDGVGRHLQRSSNALCDKFSIIRKSRKRNTGRDPSGEYNPDRWPRLKTPSIFNIRGSGMRLKPKRAISLARIAKVAALLGLVSLALTACSGGQPTPVTEDGASLHHLYKIVFWVAVVIFAIVEFAIVYMVVRYRRRKRDDESLPPQIHGNTKLEFVWTIIPTIIVIVLFILSWQQVIKAEALPGDEHTEIQVHGYQWQWRFDYGDQVEIAGSMGQSPPVMVVPVDKMIRLKLFSDNVIHAFYIPKALYKLDVIPGRANQFDVRFTQKGTFHGQCAEFCGLSHAQMLFQVKVVDQSEYDKWWAEQKAQVKTKVQQAAGCHSEATTVNVLAKSIKFDKTCVAAPADKPFEIAFDNQDPGIEHNFTIWKSKADAERGGIEPLFAGTSIKGINKTTYKVDALPAGQYYFNCTVHPVMNGTFNVGNTPASTSPSPEGPQ